MSEVNIAEKQDVPAQENAQSVRPEGSFWKKVSMMVAINVLVSGLLIFIYHECFAQKVVAMDLSTYIQRVKKARIEGKLDDKEFEKSLEILRPIVDSMPKNHVVISREVVLTKHIEMVPIVNPTLDAIVPPVVPKSAQ